MKRRAAVLAILAALVLVGCGNNKPDWLERNYDRCLAAGGSFSYHGNSGSFDCTIPAARGVVGATTGGTNE